MDSSTKEAATKRIKELRTTDLDEVVHDYKANEAAHINNGGEEEQLVYLLREEFLIEPGEAYDLVRGS